MTYFEGVYPCVWGLCLVHFWQVRPLFVTLRSPRYSVAFCCLAPSFQHMSSSGALSLVTGIPISEFVSGVLETFKKIHQLLEDSFV